MIKNPLCRYRTPSGEMGGATLWAYNFGEELAINLTNDLAEFRAMRVRGSNVKFNDSDPSWFNITIEKDGRRIALLATNEKKGKKEPVRLDRPEYYVSFHKDKYGRYDYTMVVDYDDMIRTVKNYYAFNNDLDNALSRIQKQIEDLRTECMMTNTVPKLVSLT